MFTSLLLIVAAVVIAGLAGVCLVQRSRLKTCKLQAIWDARAALTEARKTFGPRDWRVALAMDRLAVALFNQANRHEAASLFESAHEIALDFQTQRPNLLAQIERHVVVSRQSL